MMLGKPDAWLQLVTLTWVTLATLWLTARTSWHWSVSYCMQDTFSWYHHQKPLQLSHMKHPSTMSSLLMMKLPPCTGSVCHTCDTLHRHQSHPRNTQLATCYVIIILATHYVSLLHWQHQRHCHLWHADTASCIKCRNVYSPLEDHHHRHHSPPKLSMQTIFVKVYVLYQQSITMICAFVTLPSMQWLSYMMTCKLPQHHVMVHGSSCMSVTTESDIIHLPLHWEGSPV